MIILVRKVNSLRQKPKVIKCRNYVNYEPETFQTDLRAAPWDEVFNSVNVNDAWKIWKKIFSTICNKHAPFINKKVRGRDCPWITSETKSLMRQRDYFLKKAHQTNEELHWSSYRRIRNHVTNKIRAEKGHYYTDLLEENIDSPKAFWKTVKKIYPKKNLDNSPLQSLHIDGKVVTGKSQIGNALNLYFTTIVSKLAALITPSAIHSSDSSPFTDQKFNLQPITEFFTFRQLCKIKSNKATGLDMIPARLLKDSASVTSSTITHIINLSLNTGCFPNDWKNAKVVPIFKSGAKDSPDNYRPISVLPIISKILEKAVCLQLQTYLEENNLMSKFQFGFRKNYSTQLSVTFFTDNVLRAMDQAKLTGALFIDLKKAFDTVPHDGLLSKLSRYGVAGASVDWFRDYLTNRNQVVCVGTEQSDPMCVLTGVPQGSILGPLLFTIYINDLPNCLNFSHLMMYADDTVIYFSSCSLSEIKLNLSHDLRNVSNWLVENKMVLNMKKTECMLFGTSQRLKITRDNENFSVTLNEASVKLSTAFKYLGVILDDSLSYNDHIQYVVSKVSQRLGILSRVRYLLTTESANRLYKAMVLPLLEYCDITWHGCGKENSLAIERLQRRACRIVFQNSKDMPTKEIINLLGWKPLVERREAHIKAQVIKCKRGFAPELFSDYFRIKCYDIHSYNTRNKENLFIEKIKLEKTKLSFFYKGAVIFNT